MKNKDKKINNLRDKTNLIVSAILTLLGILMLVVPFLGYIEPNNLLYILFSIYACIKIIEVIITPKTNDYEDISTAIACTLAAISGFKFASLDSAMVLSLTLASWVGIMSIIKLIKLDYYHDRENGMFYVNLITFSLFLLLGLLTSINLYFSQTVQILMLGFFFVINGLLNLAEDGIRILLTSKNIKLNNVK
jgi:uncharacterized membrane protein HdeD (DUF308 family)